MMDARSEGNLVGVHPDLVMVMRTTVQIPQPFIVTYGARTEDAEKAAMASGHSKTLHSRHFKGKSGFVCAVDTAALLLGHVSFAPGHELEVFGAIAEQVKVAAERLHIPLQWGGDPIGAWFPGQVSHFRDWGHFQLPWKEYP